MPFRDQGDSILVIQEVTVEKGHINPQTVAEVASSTIVATAAAIISQAHHAAESEDWNALSTSSLEMDTVLDIDSAVSDIFATASTSGS